MNELELIADEIRRHMDETTCGFEPCETCTNFVPGEGSPHADLMLIGEAPGKREDAAGRPFVGAAGKLLGQLIESIGMRREDVFITNVLKARPPGNRDPLPGEAEHNWPWLERQIAAIEPELIVLLGRHAMRRFMPELKISHDHGKPRVVSGQTYLPVYHPAAALYTGSLKQTLLTDFAQIPALLDQIKAGRAGSAPPDNVS